jgi:hypothetical protein
MPPADPDAQRQPITSARAEPLMNHANHLPLSISSTAQVSWSDLRAAAAAERAKTEAATPVAPVVPTPALPATIKAPKPAAPVRAPAQTDTEYAAALR